MGYIRDKAIGFIYKYFLRKIFFLFDAEDIHDKFLILGNFLGKYFKTITSLFFGYQNKRLGQRILGVNFKNPVGLAAGFDKEAVLINILPRVGFGFEEVGSITGEPYKGNPRPRLWRLIKSNSLVVNYGLKNNGCEEIAQRLKNQKHKIPLGINIAKTNSKATDETEEGIKDYLKSFKTFEQIGDYFTVNISCPNTAGGEPFLEAENLDKLLSALDAKNKTKPIFIKLLPDLSCEKIDSLLAVMDNHNVQGIICGNLTRQRNLPEIMDKEVPKVGGLSGKPMEKLSNELISYVYKKTKGKYVIIGCGGVFGAEGAYKKILLGASLVQLITGMIYEGPQLIGEINRGLVKLLERDGYKNISEAVGKDSK
jgi:dihydroorotate dehydrogenase